MLRDPSLVEEGRAFPLRARAVPGLKAQQVAFVSQRFAHRVGAHAERSAQAHLFRGVEVAAGELPVQGHLERPGGRELPFVLQRVAGLDEVAVDARRQRVGCQVGRPARQVGATAQQVHAPDRQSVGLPQVAAQARAQRAHGLVAGGAGDGLVEHVALRQVGRDADVACQ